MLSKRDIIYTVVLDGSTFTIDSVVTWQLNVTNLYITNIPIFPRNSIETNGSKSLLLNYTSVGANYNHGQKSWDAFAFLRRFPIHTSPALPSPQKQCWTRVSRIFSEFQLCIGWRDGEQQENFEKDWCTVLRGNREMTEKYEYYCPVRRTFVQDCSNRLLTSLNSSCAHPLPPG